MLYIALSRVWTLTTDNNSGNDFLIALAFLYGAIDSQSENESRDMLFNSADF